MASFKEWIRSLFNWPDDTEWYYVPGGTHSGRSRYSTPGTFNEKLRRCLESPAFLKVLALQCDLFSLGKAYIYKNDKEAETGYGREMLDRLSSPNPFQSQKQFLWDYMFWLMTAGNAYLYMDSAVPSNESMRMYWLDYGKMEWPTDWYKKADRMVLSRASEKEIQDTKIKYKFDDGYTMDIRLGDIIHISDLTNGVGDWFNGPSRVDALLKIIDNVSEIVDAIAINSNYSGKFLVAGKNDIDDVSKLPMGEDEKKDVERKMNGKRRVHAMKSMVEIKRFVENMGAMKLPEHYQHQYFVIGSMYGIPQDILEAYQKSSTYENQEKAIGRHVSYTMEPKGEDLMAAISRKVGMTDRNRTLVISWDHLPFMQVFEKDRLAHKQAQINAFMSMMKLGIPVEEINQFLDTNFSDAKLEQPKGQGGQANA